MRDNIDDEDIKWPFVGLGRFYQGQTNYQETEKWDKDCLSVCKRRFGEEHPDVASSMNNLAELYRKQGKYEAAEPLYVDAIKILETVLGNEHPWTITIRNNYQIMLDKMS